MTYVNYGEDYSYAKSRLSGTVVMAKSKPVFVEDVNTGNGHILANDLLNSIMVEIELKDLDLSPVKLGYVNGHLGASYANRLPCRYWKQGYNNDNVIFKGKHYGVVSRNFAETMIGSYPSSMQCANLIMNEEVNCIAFSKDFCLSNLHEGHSLGLIYRTKLVGKAVVNPEMEEINYVLSDKYSFLQELLGETINGQH